MKVKNNFFFFTSILLLSFCSSYNAKNFISNKLRPIKIFGSNPGNLSMYVYKPQNLTSKAPLVVVLHGEEMNAFKMSKITGWNKLAETYKFLVLYVEQKQENNPNLSFNYYLKNDYSRNKGEPLSIKQMINYTILNYNINSKLIYITGFDDGAETTITMLSVYPEIFTAGAVISGSPYKVFTKSETFRFESNDYTHNVIPAVHANCRFEENWLLFYKPKLTYYHKCPVLSMNNNNFRNTTPQKWGSLIRNSYAYLNKYPKLLAIHGLRNHKKSYFNLNDIIKQWTNIHNSSANSQEKNKNYADNKNITEKIFTKNNKVILKTYTIKNLGFKIPIDPASENFNGGVILEKFSRKIKNFHSTYKIAEFFNLIKLENSTEYKITY